MGDAQLSLFIRAKRLEQDYFLKFCVIVSLRKMNLECCFNELGKIAIQINDAIAKLKEYRTALITNAVTGKIDVRDVKLPELEPVEAA
jgi:hypothetical protein